EAAVAVRAELEARRQASLDQGVYLALPRLAGIFGLTRFEEQLILLCLAPEIDLRYRKLFAYLQDDIGREQPCVELALRLLCATQQDRMMARACFSASAPLFRAQILRNQEGDHPLLARSLRLDEQVVSHLIGGGMVSGELAACCRSVTAPAGSLEKLRWPDDLKSRLASITRDQVRVSVSTQRRLIYQFTGPAGTGRTSLAAALCGEIGATLLVVDLRELATRAQNFEDAVRRMVREALLQPAAIYLEHFDQLPGDEARVLSQRRTVARAIGDLSWLTFIGTEKTWEPGGLFDDHIFLSVELPAPDLNARAALWPAIAAELSERTEDINWGEVAARFRLTPGQMRDALIAARNHSLLQDGGEAS